LKFFLENKVTEPVGSSPAVGTVDTGASEPLAPVVVPEKPKTSSFTITARTGFSSWTNNAQSLKGVNAAVLVGGQYKVSENVTIDVRGGPTIGTTGVAEEQKHSDDNIGTLGGIIEGDVGVTVNTSKWGRDIITGGAYIEGGGAWGEAHFNPDAKAAQDPNGYFGGGLAIGYRHEFYGKKVSGSVGAVLTPGWRTYSYDIPGDRSGGTPKTGFNFGANVEGTLRVHREEAVSTGEVDTAGHLTSTDLAALRSMGVASNGVYSKQDKQPDLTLSDNSLLGRSSFVIDLPSSDAKEPPCYKDTPADQKDKYKDAEGRAIDKIAVSYEGGAWKIKVYVVGSDEPVSGIKYPGTNEFMPVGFGNIESLAAAVQRLNTANPTNTPVAGLTAADLEIINSGLVGGAKKPATGAPVAEGDTQLKINLTGKGLKDGSGGDINSEVVLKKEGDKWKLYDAAGTNSLGKEFASIADFAEWMASGSGVNPGNVNVTITTDSTGKPNYQFPGLRIEFESGKSTLTDGGKSSLNTLATVLKGISLPSNYLIHCFGMASPDGASTSSGQKNNMDLATKRGKAVADYLNAKDIGVTSDSIVYSTVGTDYNAAYYAPEKGEVTGAETKNSAPYVGIVVTTRKIEEVKQEEYFYFVDTTTAATRPTETAEQRAARLARERAAADKKAADAAAGKKPLPPP